MKQFTPFEKKAIRYICGYNTDLRVKLLGTIYRDTVYGVIDEHMFQILGADRAFKLQELQKTDLGKYIATLQRLANQVCM